MHTQAVPVSFGLRSALWQASWLASHSHDLLNSHTTLHVIHSLQLLHVCQLVQRLVVCTRRQHQPGV